MSGSYNGIMSCIWDSSNKKDKKFGDMNYYDRINNKFYDEIIGQNFKKLSKGKYIKPTDYYIKSNKETITSENPDGIMAINIGTKKVIKIIFNVNIINYKISNVGFIIASNDKSGEWIEDNISGSNGKKEYDGSYTFSIDGSKKEYYNFVQIQKRRGNDYIIFNYLSLEFDQSYTIFDFPNYKVDLLY